MTTITPQNALERLKFLLEYMLGDGDVPSTELPEKKEFLDMLSGINLSENSSLDDFRRLYEVCRNFFYKLPSEIQRQDFQKNAGMFFGNDFIDFIKTINGGNIGFLAGEDLRALIDLQLEDLRNTPMNQGGFKSDNVYISSTYRQGAGFDLKHLYKPKDIDKEKNLILFPCNVGEHWVLVAIDKKNKQIIYSEPTNNEAAYKKRLEATIDELAGIDSALQGLPIRSTKIQIQFDGNSCGPLASFNSGILANPNFLKECHESNSADITTIYEEYLKQILKTSDINHENENLGPELRKSYKDLMLRAFNRFFYDVISEYKKLKLSDDEKQIARTQLSEIFESSSQEITLSENGSTILFTQNDIVELLNNYNNFILYANTDFKNLLHNDIRQIFQKYLSQDNLTLDQDESFRDEFAKRINCSFITNEDKARMIEEISYQIATYRTIIASTDIEAPTTEPKKLNAPTQTNNSLAENIASTDIEVLTAESKKLNAPTQANNSLAEKHRTNRNSFVKKLIFGLIMIIGPIAALILFAFPPTSIIGGILVGTSIAGGIISIASSYRYASNESKMNKEQTVNEKANNPEPSPTQELYIKESKDVVKNTQQTLHNQFEHESENLFDKTEYKERFKENKTNLEKLLNKGKNGEKDSHQTLLTPIGPSSSPKTGKSPSSSPTNSRS